MCEITSVILGEYFGEFVKYKVSEGRFKDKSAVVREGLRLLKEEEAKYAGLKKAIGDGMESGLAEGFGPTMHLRELKKLKSLNE